MRSAKVQKEPRGRRCRTPRCKARCTTARRSRRCPSKSPGAWSNAVTNPVMEKDVAARFRRGDILLKPQHEPDGRTLPLFARQNRDAGAKLPRGFDTIQGLDEVFSYPKQIRTASSCGEIRALMRGKNQMMACGMFPLTARRAVGPATSATLDFFNELSIFRPKDQGQDDSRDQSPPVFTPRRFLENPTPRVSLAREGNVLPDNGDPDAMGGPKNRPCTSTGTKSQTKATK